MSGSSRLGVMLDCDVNGCCGNDGGGRFACVDASVGFVVLLNCCGFVGCSVGVERSSGSGVVVRNLIGNCAM